MPIYIIESKKGHYTTADSLQEAIELAKKLTKEYDLVFKVHAPSRSDISSKGKVVYITRVKNMSALALRTTGKKSKSNSNSRTHNHNPDDMEDTLSRAQELASKFHGRPSLDITEINEHYHYQENLSKLGDLEELQVIMEDSKGRLVMQPIQFELGEVELASTSDGKQIVFVSSEPREPQLQREDVEELIGESVDDKQYVDLGLVDKIAYFADKHHLSGPKFQAKGTSYEHEFGEESGVKPRLVFDGLNERMILVGGSYRVEDIGIVD